MIHKYLANQPAKYHLLPKTNIKSGSLNKNRTPIGIIPKINNFFHVFNKNLSGALF